MIPDARPAQTAPKTRSFVAVHLSPDAKAYVVDLVALLSAEYKEQPIRWTSPENVHLTLRFMGHVESEALARINSGLAAVGGKCPPFQLSLCGLGAFPSWRSPSVLWVGLEGDLAVLNELQAQIEAAVSPFAAHEETRPFSPHITIARCKGRVGLAPLRTLSLPQLSWKVNSFELMQSKLSARGATYLELASFRLGIPEVTTGS